MTKQLHAKLERVIEAVRHGLEGEAAAEFVRQSGYAMSVPGLARHLRTLGGRGNVQDLINAGKANVEILKTCVPGVDEADFPLEAPSQGELFARELALRETAATEYSDTPLYETAKLSVRVPADLYEAIRLAAKAEGKSQSQLIVEILTAALSQMPRPLPEE